LSKIETIIYNQMKIALLGYGKMGQVIERIALEEAMKSF
jgi:pyrroline-5-carboxylate reductase